MDCFDSLEVVDGHKGVPQEVKWRSFRNPWSIKWSRLVGTSIDHFLFTFTRDPSRTGPWMTLMFDYFLVEVDSSNDVLSERDYRMGVGYLRFLGISFFG